MYAQSEKGHASERNKTHENTACSARTRRCRRPTRTTAAACGCLLTERCTTGRLGCSVFQLSSLWHLLITKSQRATMSSSKTSESVEGIGWLSVCTHFSLRQVHVVLPRRLVPQHDLTSVCDRFTLFSHVVWFRSMISPGSAPARTASSSPRTTPRRPPGAPSRQPTPRCRHFERAAFLDGIRILLFIKKARKRELFLR